MTTETKTYTIDGKTYEQRPLVYAQYRQLIEALQGFDLEGCDSSEAIMTNLGDRLPRALAIVLVEKGKHLRDKDLDAFASDLEYSIDPLVALEVVSDFFTCNPVPDLISSLAGMMHLVSEARSAKLNAASKSSSSSSAEEISASETPSSGD